MEQLVIGVWLPISSEVEVELQELVTFVEPKKQRSRYMELVGKG